jgi:hypothetical protein
MESMNSFTLFKNLALLTNHCACIELLLNFLEVKAFYLIFASRQMPRRMVASRLIIIFSD